MNPDIAKALIAFGVTTQKVFLLPMTDVPGSTDSVRELEATGWRLPFENCILAFESKVTSSVNIIALQHGEDRLFVTGGTYDCAASVLHARYLADVMQDLTWSAKLVDQELPEEVVMSFIGHACQAVLDINKSGGVAHVPTPDPKNASRKAKGKKPLFTWSTINLDAPRYKSEPKGGTHASPRLHDRRGHWVTSKLGRRFWRKDSKVGSAKNGITIQSYEKGAGMQ